MNPTEISCVSAHWRTELKQALEEVEEINLVHFLFAADIEYCQGLATAHSVEFTVETKKRVAFFRKHKLPGKPALAAED